MITGTPSLPANKEARPQESSREDRHGAEKEGYVLCALRSDSEPAAAEYLDH